MWYHEKVFYQIYTLNFCGAPFDNDGHIVHRITRINDFVDYFKELGIGGIYFNPIFSSDHHGYDTRDYRVLDERLGTNEDFKEVCQNLHSHQIKVVLDGVFNHVGRGFFAFKDVQEKREASPYKDWFRIDFNGDSPYQDNFYYEGWEGHYELVKLNLDHPDVQRYLLDSVDFWIDYFDIDGIRLDVAYSLPRWFMAMLKDHCRQKKEDFFLLGEVLGDNAGYMFSEAHLDSITDYPGFKGLWSSFNSLNMFEMAHTIKRNYKEMYQGQILWSFVDNHDVTRIASILENKNNLFPVYGLLFGMPGVPGVYYGSEWGITGEKCNGDNTLRPAIEKPEHNELTDWITALANAKQKSKALCYGGYRNLLTMPKQLIFERECDTERVIVAVNSDSNVYHADFDARSGKAVDLITGKEHDFGGGSDLQPYSCVFWKTER